MKTSLHGFAFLLLGLQLSACGSDNSTGAATPGPDGTGGALGATGGAVGTGSTAGTSGGANGTGSVGTGAGAGTTGGAAGTGGTPDPGATGLRNPCRWPFAQNSIWNTALGSGAVYVPAQLAAVSQAGMTTDPDLIVMTPTAPSVSIYTNNSGWSGGDRCPIQGAKLFDAPIPDSFVMPSGPGTPNAGLAVLMSDGHTVKQTQPFARCTAGGHGTAMYVFEDNDLYTDGIPGSHGGSGMTAIGGTLRLGELRPGKHAPRHALKGNLFAKMHLFRCTDAADCSRWPALRADGYAVGNYGTGRSGIPSAVRMGALLALAGDLNLDTLGLQTEPARQLAWTLQNYGLYVVDDTAWDVWAIESEQSPEGKFVDQFSADWGFGFESWDMNSAWSKDMVALFTQLAVVDNNTASSVGGGGTPRVPPAPDFAANCGSGIGASD